MPAPGAGPRNAPTPERQPRAVTDAAGPDRQTSPELSPDPTRPAPTPSATSKREASSPNTKARSPDRAFCIVWGLDGCVGRVRRAAKRTDRCARSYAQRESAATENASTATRRGQVEVMAKWLRLRARRRVTLR
jgi:hypothetical protein